MFGPRLIMILLATLFAVAAAGCGTESGPAPDAEDRAYISEEDGIEVPDVSYEDGADAVFAVEDEGLTAALIDVNGDFRDGTGCEVVDQSPAAGEIVADGDEVEITVDCAHVDWENQEGPGWDAFNDGYANGFDEGCQELFDQSPDGSLYEDDYEYTVADCQNLNSGDGSAASDVPADAPDDPESAGVEIGRLDGCQALFAERGVWSLNWGTDSYTEDDCPVDTYVAPPPRERKPKLTSDGCAAEQSDGTPIAIEVDRGEINCTGAEALWIEFLRRAPTEGRGSSGVVEIDGWICAGAMLSEAPRAGSCSRADNSASFDV